MSRSFNENQINHCCFALHGGRKCDRRPENWRLEQEDVAEPECIANVTRERLAAPFGEMVFDFMRRACEEEIKCGELAVFAR